MSDDTTIAKLEQMCSDFQRERDEARAVLTAAGSETNALLADRDLRVREAHEARTDAAQRACDEAARAGVFKRRAEKAEGELSTSRLVYDSCKQAMPPGDHNEPSDLYSRIKLLGFGCKDLLERAEKAGREVERMDRVIGERNGTIVELRAQLAEKASLIDVRCCSCAEPARCPRGHDDGLMDVGEPLDGN